MSLRSFHLCFIALVLLVLAGLGWLMSVSEGVPEAHRPYYTWAAYISSALLLPYLIWFWVKTKFFSSVFDSASVPPSSADSASPTASQPSSKS